MPRIRSIKPQAFTSETLAQVSIPARWTFAGLWTYCDDTGCGKDNPRLIKAELYPLDDDATPAVVVEHMDALERIGVICRYEAAGRNLFHCVSFGEHQHPSKPQPSKLPPCPKESHGTFPERSGNEAGTVPAVLGREEDKEEEGEEEKELHADEPREDVDRLCTQLADRIEGNGSKRPRITAKWRTDARLILDADKRPPVEVQYLIDWSQRSEFWRPHIQSMPKFRAKYDTLRLQAKAEAERARAPAKVGHLPYRNPSDQSVYDEPLEAS